MLYNVRIRFCVRSLCHKKLKKKRKKLGHVPLREKDKNFVESFHYPMTNARMHTHTNTHAHPLSVTLPDKHAHALTLVLISPVSLQWAHCSATPPPPNPLLATLRIIEYRSLAFAAVCKRVLLWPSVCLTGALQGHRYGNLSMGSFRCAVTEHRVTGVTWKGGQEGVGERCGAWYTGGRGEEPQGLEVPYSTVYSDWSRIMRTCTDLSVAEGHRVHYNSCYACTNKSQL